MATTSHPGPKCSCGASLHAKHKFCPSCGKQVRKSCGKCGAATQPTHTFCARCGQRLLSAIPELQRRKADIEVRIRQSDFNIASLQETANLYLGYQQRLEASKGSALLADAAASFIAKAALHHAGNAFLQHKSKIDWELLQLGTKINQARAEHAYLISLWYEVDLEIQEAQLLENQP